MIIFCNSNNERVGDMNKETLETLSLYSFFVCLFGVLGSLIAIMLNALSFYIEAPTISAYSAMIKTKLFANTFILYYLFTAMLFAGIGLLVIFIWKQNRST